MTRSTPPGRDDARDVPSRPLMPWARWLASRGQWPLRSGWTWTPASCSEGAQRYLASIEKLNSGVYRRTALVAAATRFGVGPPMAVALLDWSSRRPDGERPRWWRRDEVFVIDGQEWRSRWPEWRRPVVGALIGAGPVFRPTAAQWREVRRAG